MSHLLKAFNMERCVNFIKFLVVIINFAIAIAGLGLIVSGMLLDDNIKTFREPLGIDIHAPPISVIAVGCLILAFASFACFAALQKQRYMLITYVVILLVIFMSQLVLLVLSNIYARNLTEALDNKLSYIVEKYQEHRVILDSIQCKFHCCGFSGVNDYPPSHIPVSCCKNGPCSVNSTTIYKGCKEVLRSVISSKAIIGSLAVIIAVTEVLGIVLGTWLIAFSSKRYKNKCTSLETTHQLPQNYSN